MKYKKTLFIYILILITIVLCDIFPLKKVPAKIKTLRRMHRVLEDKEDFFLENAYGDSCDLNYYYATLYLGPKKMPQTYILDTGSPTTTTPCELCKKCGKHLNKPYELKNQSDIIKCNTDKCNIVPSSTCIDHNCGFHISYSEGSSLAGIFTMQEVYFERINKTPNITTKSHKLPIGCTTRETNLFITQKADGIMGLNNGPHSFVTLLYNNKIISKNIFTICFGQKDGYFSIGEIDTSYHKAKIEYVPLIGNERNYYVNIKQIKVGDTVIPNTYRGFIDSGTTICYFPQEIYNSIINKIKSLCITYGTKCGKFRNVEGLGYCSFFDTVEEKEEAINKYWPNITFYFEGHNYNLTANDYYYEYTNDGIGACLGFEGERASKITLGGIFMHGHDIIFDNKNQKIGFVEADCNRGKTIIDNNENSDKNNDNTNKNNNENKENIEINIHGNNSHKNNDKFINRNFLLYIIIFFVFLILIIFILIKSLRKCICKKRHMIQVDEVANSENNTNS